MPNLSASPAETWAEVRTHDRVMRYCRSGAGPPILVLKPAHAGSALWPELHTALAVRFRIIVPELPGEGVSVARWLADFLEGLGLTAVSLIAADIFCMPALELALLGGDQVGRVVLVPGGEADNAGLDGTLATPVREETIALLVVRAGLPAPDALPLVMEFLAGARMATPG